MKLIEEMTDLELAEVLKSTVLPYLYHSDDPGAGFLDESLRRLSSHPAQRIADLTGCVVTKDFFGDWCIWSVIVKPYIKGDSYWWWEDETDYAVIHLPEDNRPWQDSIYKPQMNVKNGVIDESTSAI